ncbi:hypothetical protein GX51_06550 [Blastomyces parvus]|uniref:Uncharacterized protein n=1 Tax=Blastomyces parvus TaxID=2060905 RepID=A0A2B7WHR5_9EURO|nr:hypothetical protein GX51_06550 [Blastomyces parvus]
MAGIASPIMQLKPVQVDVDVLNQPPNPANIDMHQIHFPPPFNRRPGPRLLNAVQREYRFPWLSPWVEFADFLKNQCLHTAECKSIAGFKDDGTWMGFTFKVTATENDFVVAPMTTEAFAFTT